MLQRKVLQILVRAGRPLTASQVAAKGKITIGSARAQCSRLARDKVVDVVESEHPGSERFAYAAAETAMLAHDRQAIRDLISTYGLDLVWSVARGMDR